MTRDLEGVAGMEALRDQGERARRLSAAQASLLLALAESSTGIVRTRAPGVWWINLRTWQTSTVKSLAGLGYLERITDASYRLTPAGRDEAKRLAVKGGSEA